MEMTSLKMLVQDNVVAFLSVSSKLQSEFLVTVWE